MSNGGEQMQTFLRGGPYTPGKWGGVPLDMLKQHGPVDLQDRLNHFMHAIYLKSGGAVFSGAIMVHCKAGLFF
jgi:hypothetical protein